MLKKIEISRGNLTLMKEKKHKKDELVTKLINWFF